MRPPFELTEPALELCMEIARLLGRYEGIRLPKPEPMLVRRNRIRTIQASLAIEGNRLSEGQVTAILDRKRVAGPARDILEVQNAIRAYDALPRYHAHRLPSLLDAHAMMMRGLVPDAGRLRSTHVAPKPSLVPRLMQELFAFLREDQGVHALIKSCVVHYELEFIHPFSDGNGRLGRLWQTVLLFRYHPVFEFTPVESLIKEHRGAYYKALERSDANGRSTEFVLFMLATIRESLERLLPELHATRETAESRIEKARDHFGARSFSRKEYRQCQKTLSTATASRDLARAVQQGLLTKRGDKALAEYSFIRRRGDAE